MEQSVHLLGLLCLLSVLVSVSVSSLSCDTVENGTLRIFDGDSEIPSTNCILYNSDTDCTSGTENFPNGLGQDLSVEKPGNFTVNVALETFAPGDGNTYRVNRLSYSWDGPTSGNGRSKLKGFYLKMAMVGSGTVYCKLFDLQSYSFANNANLRFELESFPVTSGGSFIVDMFSLPPPTAAEMENGLYGRHIISLPGFYNMNSTTEDRVYPDKWRTTISVQQFTEDKVLQVKFSLPENGSTAHFDTYGVAVVQKGETNAFQRYYVTMPEHIRQGGFGVHNFTNIPDGQYFVQVRPNDTYFYDEDKCQCYSKVQFGLRGCEASCASTETSPFNITGLFVSQPPSPTSPTTTTVMSSPTSKSTEKTTTHSLVSPVPVVLDQSLSDGEIAAIVVVTVSVALIGVLVVLFIIWKRRGRKLCKPNENNDGGQNDDRRHVYVVNIANPFVPSKVPDIKKKMVLLLASEDHPHFNRAMENFSHFLEYHCMCTVLLASQEKSVQLRKAENPYCWLSTNIEKADFVIIVTSEAAFHLYTALSQEQAYLNAFIRPEKDLFTTGIKQICGKIEKGISVSKVIMVHFDHTNTSFRLPIDVLPTGLYHLPNNLTPFLYHIHQLDSNKMDMTKVSLPLKGNVHQLSYGKEWLQAVQESFTYEKQHPSWFRERFGEPTTKPDYYSQTSYDSGCPSSRPGSDTMEGIQRKLSSVSMHADDDPFDQGLLSEAYLKDNFIEPSVANSAYTVPYSEYTAATKPRELDCSSTISEQMRRLNENYDLKVEEKDHGNEQQEECFDQHNHPVPREQRSAVSDPMSSPHAADLQFPDHEQDYINLALELDEGNDCISVYSAQSV